MSEPLELQGLVHQWIEKAEEDWLVVQRLCAEGPAGVVCFHAQQCVEKYVKAVLTLHGIDFPKIHGISELAALLPEPGVPVEQERLTDYATVTGYPGDYDPIGLEEAQAAVELARRARACLRRLIPEQILSK